MIDPLFKQRFNRCVLVWHNGKLFFQAGFRRQFDSPMLYHAHVCTLGSEHVFLLLFGFLRSSCHGTQNPETRNQKPKNRTQNPEPRTQNPEPRTQNRKPRTQNPEPRTMCTFLNLAYGWCTFLNLARKHTWRELSTGESTDIPVAL